MNRRGLLKSFLFSPFLYGYSSKGIGNTECILAEENNKEIKYSTPEMFGSKKANKTNTKVAIEKALTYSHKKGIPCRFSGGVYDSEDIDFNFPVNIIIEAGSYLNFILTISGERLSKSDTIKSSLSWDECTRGKISFPMSSNQYKSGDIISIELDDIHGGNAQKGNQNGIDILEINDNTTSVLSFKNKTRFPYFHPKISKLNNVIKISGVLNKGTKEINGNFEGLFSAGDILRIENIDGEDSVSGSRYYFEYIKVSKVLKDRMVLKSRTIYSHKNPWIIKTGFLEQVHITGNGGVKKLVIQSANDVIVSSLLIKRLILSNCYEINLSNVKSDGLYEPSTINITYCFGKSIIENLNVSSSFGITDNAVLKVMSSPQLILSNVVISDSNSNSKKQGNYCLFIDALYTPYLCWNDNIIVNNVICEKSSSNISRSIWFYGLRNSVIDSIVGADTFLQGSIDTMFKGINIPGHFLEIKDLVRCTVDSKCAKVLIEGGQYNVFELVYGSTKSLNKTTQAEQSRTIKFTRGKIQPETGETYSIGSSNYLKLDGYSWISKETYPSLYVEYQDNLSLDTDINFDILRANIVKTGAQVSQLAIKNK
ncbi:hypothetical protein ACJWUX_25760 [Klebsiella pneumoniae]